MKLTSKMVAFVAVLALAIVPAVALAHGSGQGSQGATHSTGHRHYPGPHSSLSSKRKAYGKVCAATYSKKLVPEDPSAIEGTGDTDKNPATDNDGDKFSMFVNCVVMSAKAAHSNQGAKALCGTYSHKKDADGDYRADTTGNDTDTSDPNEATESTTPQKGTPFSRCVHTMKQVKNDVHHGKPA